jgi:flagellum-specific peptidoglycan hydrolase FlgJ
MAATKAQQEDFIKKITPLIQQEAIRRGYPICSAVIAQACLESAYGLSGLAKYHNYFGLKCGSSWTGKSVNMTTKEEYQPGTLTTIRDNFRVFDSMPDGVAGYYDFINTKRYAALKTARTPQEYLERIKAAGYATSSGYVVNTMSVVYRHDLTRFDREASQGAGNPYDEPIATIRHGMRGDGVRWLQTELNRHGYILKVDGIAGDMTIGAVLDFQKRHGLVVDGLCGPATRAALLS